LTVQGGRTDVQQLVRRRLGEGVVIASCLLLAGCGGSGRDRGAIPSDASVKDFCKAGDTFARATKFSDGVKAAGELRSTGTPTSIPGAARDGFELVVELVTKSKDQPDLEKRYARLTASQKKSVDKLDAYIAKTC
jgi:hypothetical protein